ncbi:gamma-glutamyl-gamma-aminobutyrate hydrolase family protein [Pseudomonas sp. NPDC089534]|uniref:gamma-glutamyl-gamma-aminobutyrate hydrolase family protein n=1 Tax=Pseudomonas sp. NPDC089534 TaxID=3364468 RepID=UPI00382B00D7
MTGPLQEPRRAVVGVTANRQLLDGVHRERLRRRYIEALERHGPVECVILPTVDGDQPWDVSVSRLRRVLGRLDGLVLTGDESNLDPAIFAGEPRAWNRGADDVIPEERDRPRDRLSSAALTVALELDMPVLGICRGFQEMSVHRGGALHADLKALGGAVVHSENPDVPRDQQYLPAHSVRVVAGGWLASLVGEVELQVNSLHNQGITAVPPGVRPEAVAQDGVIEALSYATSDTFQFGVQWHPEWHAANDATSQKLFKAFADACLVYQAKERESA